MVSLSPPPAFFPPLVRDLPLWALALITAGGLGAIYGGGFLVSMARIGAIKNAGDLKDKTSRLYRLNRAHGNASEYYPALALVVALIFLGQASMKTATAVIALIAFASRTAHYLGFVARGEGLGIALTLFSGLALCVLGVVDVFSTKFMPVTLQLAKLCQLTALSFVFVQAFFVVACRGGLLGGKDQDQDDPDSMLYKTRRTHANNAEYTPMFVALMFVTTLPPAVLMVMSMLWLLARIFHWIGMYKAPPIAEKKAHWGRFWGATLTYLLGFAAIVISAIDVVIVSSVAPLSWLLTRLVITLSGCFIFILGFSVSLAIRAAVAGSKKGTEESSLTSSDDLKAKLHQTRRTHGNATEYLPMLCAALLAASPTYSNVLPIIALVNLLARSMWTTAMRSTPFSEPSKLRFYGAVLNYTSGIVLFLAVLIVLLA